MREKGEGEHFFGQNDKQKEVFFPMSHHTFPRKGSFVRNRHFLLRQWAVKLTVGFVEGVM